MSRYYTCAKCKNLVKESVECATCVTPKVTTGNALIKYQDVIGTPNPWIINIDDINSIDDENSTGD